MLVSVADAIRVQMCSLLVSDVQHLGEAAAVAITKLIIDTALVQDCVSTSDRVVVLTHAVVTTEPHACHHSGGQAALYVTVCQVLVCIDCDIPDVCWVPALSCMPTP